MTTPARTVAWASIFAVLFGIALLLLVTGCGPVEDGGKGTSKVLGGRIQNDPDSIQRINAYYSWGPKDRPAGHPTLLKPGAQTSKSKDADGFCTIDYPAKVAIRNGIFTINTTVAPGKCKKIQDTDSVVVTVVKSLN